jgi:hypothetical protein
VSAHTRESDRTEGKKYLIRIALENTLAGTEIQHSGSVMQIIILSPTTDHDINAFQKRVACASKDIQQSEGD